MSKSSTSAAARKPWRRSPPAILKAFTIPGSVVSAATSSFDGDFIATPQIRHDKDLKGKRLGVQSVGGGVWSMAMLALEHLGLKPTRDKMTVIICVSLVLAQSL